MGGILERWRGVIEWAYINLNLQMLKISLVQSVANIIREVRNYSLRSVHIAEAPQVTKGHSV